mmetsp:Transcript_81874/g.228137  ORF Transcript_81874/g.228137 Transcript_81874/m.228137 type:complete len:212 (+) Transcript_81874:855-1490(+)
MLVLESDPAGDSFFASPYARTEDIRELLLARALQELEDVCLCDCPDGLLAAEFLLQGNLFPTAVQGLLHLLEEWRALIALNGDPALDVINQGSRPDTQEAEVLIFRWALQDLEDLALIFLQLSQGFRGVDVEDARQCDVLDGAVVHLDHGQEAPPGDAVGADAAAKQFCVIRFDGEALQRSNLFAEARLWENLLLLRKVVEQFVDAHFAPL